MRSLYLLWFNFAKRIYGLDLIHLSQRHFLYFFVYQNLRHWQVTIPFLLLFFFGDYSWRMDILSNLGWVNLFYLIITLSKKSSTNKCICELWYMTTKHIYRFHISQFTNKIMPFSFMLAFSFIFFYIYISHIYFAIFMLL